MSKIYVRKFEPGIFVNRLCVDYTIFIDSDGIPTVIEGYQSDEDAALLRGGATEQTIDEFLHAGKDVSITIVNGEIRQILGI